MVCVCLGNLVYIRLLKTHNIEPDVINTTYYFGPIFMNENTGEMDRCEFNLLLITALLNFYQGDGTKNS